MRLALLNVFIAIVALAPTRVSATDANESVVNLRNAAIPEESLKQLDELRSPTDPARKVCGIGSSPRYVYLTRPASQNIVTVLMQSPNEMHFSLNPFSEIVNYGVIPPLAEMTPDQTEQLWGKGEDSSTENRTYELEAVKNWSDKRVFIDVVLKNNHIEKYRVRGWMTKNENDWHAVK